MTAPLLSTCPSRPWQVTAGLTLCVTDRWSVTACAREIGATHIVSIGDPGDPPQDYPLPADRVLRLEFHDTARPQPPRSPVVSPHWRHVKQAVDFVQAAMGEVPAAGAAAGAAAGGVAGVGPAVVLVHCHQGVSRSTAMALALAASVSDAPALDLLHALADARPVADPNPLVLEGADTLFRRTRGRDLYDALQAWRGSALMAADRHPDFA